MQSQDIGAPRATAREQKFINFNILVLIFLRFTLTQFFKPHTSTTPSFDRADGH